MRKIGGSANTWLVFIVSLTAVFLAYSIFSDTPKDTNTPQIEQVTIPTTTPTPEVDEDDPLTFLNKHGKANVIVSLDTEDFTEEDREELLNILSETNANIYYIPEDVPEMAMTVDEESLKILIDSDYVSKIKRDVPSEGF